MTRLTRAAAACALALAVASPTLACMPPQHMADFGKYPAEVYTGAKKDVDFASHPVAAALSAADRERVTKAVEAGPNFAGTYRIVYATCGEKCSAALMVNVATGKVIGVPVEKNSYANFRANSRYLIVRTAGQPARSFVFDGGEFKPAEAPSES